MSKKKGFIQIIPVFFRSVNSWTSVHELHGTPKGTKKPLVFPCSMFIHRSVCWVDHLTHLKGVDHLILGQNEYIMISQY